MQGFPDPLGRRAATPRPRSCRSLGASTTALRFSSFPHDATVRDRHASPHASGGETVPATRFARSAPGLSSSWRRLEIAPI